jgi:hypothetical protein
MPELLRLIALDPDDLAVISANLQDALVRIGDMTYLSRSKRFVIVAARFDWLRARAGSMERCRAGLHFERVLKVARSGFSQGDGDTVLNLLSIVFEETEAPAGRVVLTFSAGAAIRLDVECLEAQLRDIGPRWKTKAQPGHLDDEQPQDSGAGAK